MMIIITNTHADWPAKYEPAHLGQLEHLSLLFSLSKERKVFEQYLAKNSAKSVVNLRFCFLNMLDFSRHIFIILDILYTHFILYTIYYIRTIYAQAIIGLNETVDEFTSS
jgi:hypothetical protein